VVSVENGSRTVSANPAWIAPGRIIIGLHLAFKLMARWSRDRGDWTLPGRVGSRLGLSACGSASKVCECCTSDVRGLSRRDQRRWPACKTNSRRGSHALQSGSVNRRLWLVRLDVVATPVGEQLDLIPQVHPVDPPHPSTLRSSQLIGEKVAPALGWRPPVDSLSQASVTASTHAVA
jgi:hypothetical protein